MSIDDKTENTIVHTLTTPPEASRFQPRVSLLFYHRGGARHIELFDGQATVVGRARPADVAISDSSLSRQHARLEFIDQVLWVTDLESTNGTRVNRRRIKKRTRVSTEDVVRMGAVTVAAHVLSPSDQGMAGLESHDRLIAGLEKEIERCAAFERAVALLLVDAPKGEHISGWIGRVHRAVRNNVDVVALYGPSAALVYLVESDLAHASSVADAIAERQRGEPQLRCGVALYPRNGKNVDELLESARAATRATSSREPIAVASADGAAVEIDHGAPLVVSERMRAVYQQAERIANAVVPVLITGETGTGKEVLARRIHEVSSRKRKPLRSLNCAAIPAQLVDSALFGHERGAFTGAERQTKGVFEQGDGGTVLLDEVGELSPEAQAALLRVLETKRLIRVGGQEEIAVDVRLLAATNRDLEKMVEQGTFRSDLLYRLNTMVLHLPPLRERSDEVVPLAERFMKSAAKENKADVKRIDDEAIALLSRYGWPGNVRELRNVIERAVLIAQDKTITRADLPDRLREAARGNRRSTQALPSLRAPSTEDDGASIKERLARYEAELLLDALRQHEWNQTRTAEALGMPLRTLVHKMKKFGLKKQYDLDGGE